MRFYLSSLAALLLLAACTNEAPVFRGCDPGHVESVPQAPPVEPVPVKDEQTPAADAARFKADALDMVRFWRNEARLAWSRDERARLLGNARRSLGFARDWHRVAKAAT